MATDTARAGRFAKVRDAFAKHVPEIATGRIEIVAVALIEGLGAKVAVRATSFTATEVVAVCVGYHGQNVDVIRNELGLMFINVFEWTDDRIEYFCRIAYLLRRNQIVDVKIDDLNKHARIFVTDAGAMAIGIGLGEQLKTGH